MRQLITTTICSFITVTCAIIYFVYVACILKKKCTLLPPSGSMSNAKISVMKKIVIGPKKLYRSSSETYTRVTVQVTPQRD